MKLFRWTLILILGAAALSLALPGGWGLIISEPWSLTTSPPNSATPVTTTPALGLRTVSYTVIATANALAAATPANVVLDYVDTDARPAHVEVTLPWQHTAQLAPGMTARLVAEADAGPGFVARIYVDSGLQAEAEAGPVAGAAGAPQRWRAQAEAAIAAP